VEIESARIRSLAQAVGAGDAQSLATFWKEVERDGAPLVEPIAGDGAARLVTFVWRDADGSTERVQVLSGPAPMPGTVDDLFRHLPGTDVWYRSYRVRSDFRGTYRLVVNDPDADPSGADLEALMKRFGTAVTDPHNLHPHRVPEDPESSDPKMPPGSELVLPDAPPGLWFPDSGDAPQGTLDLLRVESRILGNTRRVWVYASPGVGSGAPAALAVLCDGAVWALREPIAPTFDRLVADGTLPPLVAVMVDALDGETTRMRELGRHAPFLAFLADELLPLVRSRWAVTDDPARTAIAGESLGGLTAGYAVLERPDVFGLAVCQSGSFWWPCEAAIRMDGDWQPGPLVEGAEVMAATVREAGTRQPVSLSLEVGLFEGSIMLWPNRRLRDALLDNGYRVRYREFAGCHEWFSWRGTLARELAAMLGH